MIDVNLDYSRVEKFPEKIFIEKTSLNFPLTLSILRKCNQVPVEVIDDRSSLIEEISEAHDPLTEGKKYLLLAENKGEFIKPCPCTPHYIGCNYYIMNLDLNCPLDCSYCVLQSYLDSPVITVHVNTDELWRQLDMFLKAAPRVLRLGTGELGDSLALDPITGRSRDLIAYFRSQSKGILELKTKTTHIDHILTAKPAENVIIAWSLNAREVACSEERNAPSIKERILAAQQVVQRGFRVAFHFDPLIRFPGWEKGYQEIVGELLERISPSQIVWISLGSLRFPPSLKSIIRKRFPATEILYEEFILGKDGKLRYFKPLRLELFQKIISFIKHYGKENIPVYLCMENAEIWRKALQNTVKDEEEVETFLTSPFGSV